MRRLLILVLVSSATFLMGCGGGGYEPNPEALSKAVPETVDESKRAAETAKSPVKNAPVDVTNDSRSDSAANDVNPDANENVAAQPVVAAPPKESPLRRPRSGGMVGSVLGARNRNTASSNGRQLAMGMAQADRYPKQAIVAKDGTPLLSWRVKVLQSLDKNLYNAFNHEEPWDHPDNLKLLDKMPTFFKAGYANEDEGYTVFMVVKGDNTLFPDPAKSRRGLSIDSVRDGTSKTVLFVVAEPSMGAPWTKPQDIDFDPAKPGAGIVGPDGTFVAAFCDGSVRRLSGLDDATLNAIMTPRGGEVVGQLD